MSRSEKDGLRTRFVVYMHVYSDEKNSYKSAIQWIMLHVELATTAGCRQIVSTCILVLVLMLLPTLMIQFGGSKMGFRLLVQFQDYRRIRDTSLKPQGWT